MKELNAWWRRAARRAERAVRLEDALLGGRFASYALHRLRYLGARTLVGTVLHAARIVLAYRLFRPSGFAAILVLEAIASIAGGFWWGTLEVLRSRVRELFRSGRQRETAAVIEAWLLRALRLGSIVAAAAVAWPVAQLTIFRRTFTPVDFYITAVLIRFALDVVGRCFHSGIYAVRRVYRPLFSLLFVEFLTFGAVLGLWPLIRAWALPAASLVSALAAAGMVLHYSARTYRHVGLAPWKTIGLLRPSRRNATRWTDGLAAGAAYAALRLEGILPLVVAAFPGRGRMPLAAFLLAVAPLVRAGSDWAQLFYFDLKRLDLPLLGRLRVRFERRMAVIAVPIGVLLGLAAFAFGQAIPGRMDATFGAALLVFFVLRSEVAALQMRAFTVGAYGALILSGLIGAAGWLPAGRLSDRPLAALGLGSASLAAAALPVLRRKGGGRPSSRPEFLTLPDWMERLKGIPEPVSVSAATFSPGSVYRGLDDPARWIEEDRWSHRMVGEAVVGKLGPRGAVAPAGPGLVVWYERAGRPRTVSPEWLLVKGAGLIRLLRTTGETAGGREALRRAAELGFFGETIKAPERGSGPTISRLIEEFRGLAPRGVVLDPETGLAEKGSPSPTSVEMQSAMAEALAYAAGFSSFPRRSDFEVTAYVENGEIRFIFLLDAGTPPTARSRWRARLRCANLQAAIFPS
jgi:hypothetical protein